MRDRLLMPLVFVAAHALACVTPSPATTPGSNVAMLAAVCRHNGCERSEECGWIAEYKEIPASDKCFTAPINRNNADAFQQDVSDNVGPAPKTTMSMECIPWPVTCENHRCVANRYPSCPAAPPSR
jgi:hypothetical protein